MYIHYRAEVKKEFKKSQDLKNVIIFKWKGWTSIKQNEWVKYCHANTYSWSFSSSNIKKKTQRDYKEGEESGY